MSGEEKKSSSSNTVGRKASSAAAAGVLEGMDPETGNFIRDSPLNRQKKSPPLTPVGTHTLPSSGSASLKTDLERGLKEAHSAATLSVGEAGVLKKTWSKRLVSTMSNKNREVEEEDNDEEIANHCIFGRQIRFTIMVISTLCLASILSNILTFNFAYICMVGYKTFNASNSSHTEEADLRGVQYNPNLDYTSVQRSILFMAVAVGALLAVFPLTIMLNKYGSRLVFGALGYVSAFATLLTPASANMGFGHILIMRLIQGACFSACLPVMGSITSHWSTLKQNGIFIAILSSFLQIAPIFTMPVSGALCTSPMGWPSIYYLHGFVSIVLFTIFMLYHRNTPHKHPMMTRTEIIKVMFNKGGSIYSGAGSKEKKGAKKVPYAAMYRDQAIWAILVASFGNFMGTQLSLQFMPTYINKVLFLPVEQTGMASAISPTIMFFVKLMAGQSSDRITFISDEWKLRIYNTLSMGMMGALFITLALLNPQSNPSMCLVVLVTSTCILGFNSGGFFKSSQMVSRQHSHFTLANISFINCVCMLLTPLLNEVIAPENRPENWAIVLWTHGIILLSTNLFFCFFASSKPARWTLETFDITKVGSKNKVAPLSPTTLTPPKIMVEKVDECTMTTH